MWPAEDDDVHASVATDSSLGNLVGTSSFPELRKEHIPIPFFPSNRNTDIPRKIMPNNFAAHENYHRGYRHRCSYEV